MCLEKLLKLLCIRDVMVRADRNLRARTIQGSFRTLQKITFRTLDVRLEEQRAFHAVEICIDSNGIRIVDRPDVLGNNGYTVTNICECFFQGFQPNRVCFENDDAFHLI